jgi:hypothetical protein
MDDRRVFIRIDELLRFYVQVDARQLRERPRLPVTRHDEVGRGNDLRRSTVDADSPRAHHESDYQSACTGETASQDPDFH